MLKLLEDQIDNTKSLVLLNSLNLVYMLGLIFFPKSLLVEGVNKVSFFLIAFFLACLSIMFSDSKKLLVVKCILILYVTKEEKTLFIKL